MKHFFKKLGLLASAFLLMFMLSSHELFLKSDSYFLQEGEPTELYLFNGTFDSSENSITTDRITGARIAGPDFDFLPKDSDYYIKGNVTHLKLTPGKSGTYVAGISTFPRMIDLNAKEFREYLEHEGLDQVIDDRAVKGVSDEPAREKYSKHVKAILQVDENRTGHFKMELGYPIEFIPLTNPYELKVGDMASFQLKVNGKPLAGQGVHISSRNDGVDPFAKETPGKTNEKGEVSFEITETGHWYVATIHMIESREDGVDYESNWATITFEVGQ